MSRLLHPKKRRPSTPTSPRSSPSSQPSTSPDPSEMREYSISVSPQTRARMYPHKILGELTSLMGPTTRTRVRVVRGGKGSVNPTCRGTQNPQPLPLSLATPVAKKPVGFCEPLTETCPKQSSMSESPLIPLPESPLPSGSESSRENQSISTTSSRHSTILSLMKKERVAWETRRLLLESLNRGNAFPQQPSGLLHGEEPPRLSVSPSLIAEKNSSTTAITLNQNSPPSSSLPTTKSYYMTQPCAMKLQEGNMSSSLTTTDSTSYIPQSSCLTESNPLSTLRAAKDPPDLSSRLEANQKYATNTTLGHAKTLMRNADTVTSARIARNPDTVERIAPTGGANEIYGLQPKYLRHNLWDKGSSLSPTTAEWTESARPLPRPSLAEITNPITHKTITEHPDLFQVSTPVNVDVFESLLKTHPNPSFVKSVCAGLREGFWPWADTLNGMFPVTHDASRAMPSDPKHASFIREQCLKERRKGYFSESFGTELLPGMYSMPIHAVPKPHSADLRMVNDHSAGPFSLNNMIDHSQVTGFPLDNMRHLGEMLFDIRQKDKDAHLTLWKSDIADAYRLLPMHPLWQVKQVVTVDNERYIDRNLCFGSSGSSGIFISFNSLVSWIAKYIKLIPYLSGYMDDSSGCNRFGDTLLYEPYGIELPSDQCRLLWLWDELGIPHKPHKQVFGSPLTIIGIDVDPNMMTLTLPDESKERLISELRVWSAKPPRNSTGSFKLKYWERLAGWFNWALNVYPLLRPALNNIYFKMSGKRIRDQRVYINNAIREDLIWAITHIESSSGVQLFESFSWTPSSADFVIMCDACPSGMGFWYPVSKEGYFAPTPVNAPTDAIFYFEALCVLSAIINVQSKAPTGSKILIYTDNTNTVDIFRSLRCLPVYNPLLKLAVDVLIENNYSLRVLHISGDENVVADALSRVQFSVALSYEQRLNLYSFNPPSTVGSSV
jgi:hypothetical protein